MIPTSQQEKTYKASLEAHIRHVQEAGRDLGVPKDQLDYHDASKWTAHEFPYYAMKYGGDDPGQDKGGIANRYAAAWLHHIHNNPHHWQHWIFPDGYTPKGSTVERGVVEMPQWYALEMVADWMGASMAYTGSWDMAKWLYENMPRIRLHSRTADYVRGVLDMLGYADVIYVQRWAQEQERKT